MSILVKHFVGQPRMHVEIAKLNLEERKSSELTQLITLLYHQKLLNRFLEYLEEEDKKIFLELLLLSTDENYLEFLHQKIEGIEKVVEAAILEIEEQIQTDLQSLIENN